jgi:exonuclease SbcD
MCALRTMKVAITADLHLAAKKDCPERYNALKNILEQITDQNIKTKVIENLIIAGDLFDKEFRNYSEFESLCKKYPKIQMHIIPGNHDPDINEQDIVGDNIHIYTAPTPVMFGNTTFLFIPYKKDTNMSEHIAAVKGEIKGKDWFLVSHGDYYGGTKEINPREAGTYMPLSRANVAAFKPKIVFLGHIHKPSYWKVENVYYTGSPCGLDITETGKRRFLVCDTKEGKATGQSVATDVIYFDETFTIVPSDNEVPLLNKEIKDRIKEWGLASSDYEKVVVRVKVIGYASDRSAISKALKDGFAGFSYYQGTGPFIGDLSISSDVQLKEIAQETMDLINKLSWDFGGDEPDRELITTKALKVIYGA